MTEKNIDKESLMHYTDFAGLNGILNDNYLRLTDATRTNDTSELNLAYEYIKNACMENFTTFSNKSDNQLHANSIVQTVKSMLLGGDFSSEKPQKIIEGTYISCFCKVAKNDKESRFLFKNGLLSQWRGYGSAQGYAIIFNKEQIERIHGEFKDSEKGYNHLGEIKYPMEYLDFKKESQEFCFDHKMYSDPNSGPNLEESIKIIVQRYQKCREQFIKNGCHDGFINDSALPHISTIMLSTIFFKHYGFHEEREYRISHTRKVMSGKENNIWFYNTSNNIIKSYIKFGDKKITNAIEEILIGPSKNKHKNKEQLEKMLFHLNLKKIKVTVSEIPFI